MSKACAAYEGSKVEGVGFEICLINPENVTMGYNITSTELFFTKETFERLKALIEKLKKKKRILSGSPRIHTNGNNNSISVEFQSLLMLWNVEKLKLLKQIQFYNGRNALQKTVKFLICL